MTFKTFAAGLIAAAAFALPASAADISGAGASFPYPVYTKWADAYKKQTGIGLNYQSIGSGGGIKQIQSKTVAFGATDMPLKAEQLEKDGLIQFPTVLGGVVPIINVEGIKSGEIVLDGPVLAKIFLGQIKTWNDADIQKLNASVKLPAQPIVVVRRSDGSGTTFLFTDYLAKVSADWKSKVGASTAVEWPTGIGAKGNEGVANNVGQTKGSIGYVEYAYAKQNKMTHAKMINKDGKAVEPTAELLHGRRGECELGRHAWLRRRADQRNRPHQLADRRRHLHPDPQAADQAGRRGRGAQILLLGLCQWRQDGARTRIRSDARQGRRRDPEGLGGAGQGRVRQASVRSVELISAVIREGRFHRPSHFPLPAIHLLCLGRWAA